MQRKQDSSGARYMKGKKITQTPNGHEKQGFDESQDVGIKLLL